MRRAFKFRLYPNANQQLTLAQSLETHRRIYNQALAERKDAWEKDQRSVRFQQQYQRFAALRNEHVARQKAGEEGPCWYAQIASVSMRDTLKRLDKAFQNFFRRCQTG